MPELPEVEVTRRGIAQHLQQQVIQTVIVRHTQLRWPVPPTLDKHIKGHSLVQISRRGKYLLLQLTQGALIIHLGMSGSLHILPNNTPADKHDHIDIQFSNGFCLRFRDPRRFGCLLWTSESLHQHFLLRHLGKEPFTRSFTGQYLYQRSRHCKRAIKLLIMDHKIMVGIGNCYANEVLFHAYINPHQAADTLHLSDYIRLVASIRFILTSAIKQGGSTLRNFSGSDGQPGYFSQQLQVYGRDGQPCLVCSKPLVKTRLGQRTTVYCKRCQP